MGSRTLGSIDLLGADDVAGLASVSGPCLSVFLPTHRYGAETRQDPLRLRNLLDAAERALRERGEPASLVEDLLAPARTLVDDAPFWQHQSDGLAIFSAPGSFSRFRVPLALPEEVSVGPSFRVRPLLPLLAGDGLFFLLAVSQNKVRLFEATRHTIGELDLGPIPASIDEALAHEDPERQLQHRTSGAAGVQFHGHGAGDEVDKAAVERFLRAVDRGLLERVGSVTTPLVLACVGYLLPIYRSVSRYPAVVDVAAEGNPDERSPDDLHAAAWPAVEPRLTEDARRALARFTDAGGSGRAVTDVEEIAVRAWEGRVDTLFATGDGDPVPGQVDPERAAAVRLPAGDPGAVDLVDRAVLDTLARGGTVVPLEALGRPDLQLAALLRH